MHSPSEALSGRCERPDQKEKLGDDLASRRPRQLVPERVGKGRKHAHSSLFSCALRIGPHFGRAEPACGSGLALRSRPDAPTRPVSACRRHARRPARGDPFHDGWVSIRRSRETSEITVIHNGHDDERFHPHDRRLAFGSGPAVAPRCSSLGMNVRRSSSSSRTWPSSTRAARCTPPRGTAPLFAYCTRALGLSEDAAYRRIEAARACRRFPGDPRPAGRRLSDAHGRARCSRGTSTRRTTPRSSPRPGAGPRKRSKRSSRGSHPGRTRSR